MNISREKKKEEALIRMKVIAEHFNLGDKLINYLKDDKLYYSYAYSMDTINYDERYVKIVQDFERLNITLRRSRLSGVARATTPDKQSHLVTNYCTMF